MSSASSVSVSRCPTGLYIHLPFCLSRCGYCTFVSRVYDSGLADAYLDALENEMRQRAYFSPSFLPESIFIGGGTPSCLDVTQLERLLQLLPQPVIGEATCEVNPDSCSEEKLRLLQEYGVNRISFGVQTFAERGLRLLQRRHDAAMAIRAVELAVAMKFASVSVDLIHGWPGQTEKELLGDLSISVDLGIRHLSNYALIVDADAAAYTTYRSLLGGDEIDGELGRRYWEKIEEFLEIKEFKHYETSNFCQEGYACRHNVAIWRGGEYLGVGLGACSHIAGERFANTVDMEEYIQCSTLQGGAIAYRETLEREEKARECAVFWLRLFDGVELEAFRAKTGVAFSELYEDVLPGLLKEGVMQMDAERVWVAREYQPLLDSVLEQLI